MIMVKRKNNEFCSLEPDFPKEAFITFLLLSENYNMLGMYPMPSIYRTFDDVTYSMQKTVHEANKKGDFSINDICILIPISFAVQYPLRREFWTKPAMHFGDNERIKIFTPVALHPEFYRLLITPTYFDNNGIWHLHATLPLHLSTNFSAIEQFMLLSDQPVDERAKYAAVYNLGHAIRYNWKTKETSTMQMEVREKTGLN